MSKFTETTATSAMSSTPWMSRNFSRRRGSQKESLRRQTGAIERGWHGEKALENAPPRKRRRLMRQ
jgi:hypothetical protein